MTDVSARRAARVLVLDGSTVLLFRCSSAHRPEDGPWWITPGGGLEADEDLRAGAVRELAEETGLVVDPADFEGPVHEEVVEYPTATGTQRQTQQYLVLRRGAFEIDRRAQTDWERRFMGEARWWTSAELRAATETVYPPNLADLLDRLSPPGHGSIPRKEV